MKNFPLIISKRLLKVLSLIDNQIAKDLIELNGSGNLLITQTFIDVDTQNSSSVTFIQSNKAAILLNIDGNTPLDKKLLKSLTLLDKTSNVYNQLRSSNRIGRFIIKNFPDKYDNNTIETFVNMFKSATDRDVLFGLMDVVNGKKIPYWYSRARYYEQQGSLGNSCMKSQPKSTFDIYANNEDTCSLVIMYADSNKRTIKGRALLWKLSVPENRYFMDRIYTTNYSYQQVFIDFAKFNNWLYKVDQSSNPNGPFIDPLNNKIINGMDMMLDVQKIKFQSYPYFDTMTYFSHTRGTISNTQKFGAEIYMQCTGGGYSEISTYFSKYHNCSISKSNAVYCLIGDDYVRKGEEVRVYNYGDETEKREKVFAVPGHESIAKMELTIINKDGEKENISKCFPKEKCTWSSYLRTWVFTDSIVLVWSNIEKTEQVIEYTKRLNFSFVELNGEYYIKDTFNKKTIQVKKKITKKQ